MAAKVNQTPCAAKNLSLFAGETKVSSSISGIPHSSTSIMTNSKRARATKNTYAERVQMLREQGHLFSKRSELVKYAQQQFGCSSVQARTYVREAFADGLLTPVDIQKDYLEYSSKINYYLAKAVLYIDCPIELNQMLRSRFKLSQQEAKEYIDDFKTTQNEWINNKRSFNKDARNEAYRQLNIKVITNAWPKASIFKCTDCTAQAEHYHHPNYAYPLWVEPVCQVCHTRIHTILAQRLLD